MGAQKLLRGHDASARWSLDSTGLTDLLTEMESESRAARMISSACL